MPARVQVFTTTYCPYCRRATALLDRRHIAYEEIDVTLDPQARAWLVRATGGRKTVPQIFIDGAGTGGCDDLHELDRRGKLIRLAKVP